MFGVTWPIRLPGLYMVKTKKLLLWNQKINDLESWYAAPSTLVLPSLFKWWPWVDLGLFYGKVKFTALCVCMGTHFNSRFPRQLLKPLMWKLAHKVNWMSTWRFMSTHDQGHSLIFVQGHSDLTWQNQQSDYVPSEDSDQPGYPPSLIRVFAVRMKKPWVLSYPLSAQRRLWSDWADAQADLSLRWVHSHFVGFVMLRLMW